MITNAERVLLTIVLALSMAACNEAVTPSGGNPDAGMGGGTDAGSQGAPDAGGGGTDSGLRANPDSGIPLDAGMVTDGSTAAPGLVINEIRASGDDWIELYNAGTAAADLSGLRISDANSDGTPKLVSAVTVPDGVTVPVGGFFFILAHQSMPAVGLTSDCLDPSISQCLQAGWGISASNGETVFVIDSSNAIVAHATYPANAVPSGQSWGRLPDGTGDFAANTPTPGAANMAAP